MNEVNLKQEDMAIGDLNSKEKGSAARANSGKPNWGLMPLRQVACALRMHEFMSTRRVNSIDLMSALGDFQAFGNYQTLDEMFERGLQYLIQDKQISVIEALEEVIAVWEFGAKKYAAWNWMKGMPWSQCIASAQRHANALYLEQTLDKESGLHHAAHYLCNVMMLRHYIIYYTEGNDLPLEHFT